MDDGGDFIRLAAVSSVTSFSDVGYVSTADTDFLVLCVVSDATPKR